MTQPVTSSETAVQMVAISLRSTFGYGNPKAYYGPGEAVSVPVGLARMLGKLDETAVAQPTPALTDLPGVGAEMAGALTAAGFVSVGDIASATIAQLTAVSGIGKATATKLKTAAEELI